MDADAKATSLRKAILAAIQNLPPITPDQMAVFLRVPGKYMDVRKRFSELYQAGYIDRCGVGKSIYGKPQHAYMASP